MRAAALSILAWCLVNAVSGCCKPTENPDDSVIRVWEQREASADDAACASAMEEEPNDDVVWANALGGQDECQERELSLAVAGDSDVAYIWGERCPDMHPRATLAGSGRGLRLCLFVACTDGMTGVDGTTPCFQGEVFQTLEGVIGCCSKGEESTVEVNVNCDADFVPFGSADEFDAYVALDHRETLECEERTITVRL
jgi:hypothetical protein